MRIGTVESALLLAVACGSSQGVIINQYAGNESRFDRLEIAENKTVTGPNTASEFVLAGHDLSGVGWMGDAKTKLASLDRACTLVTSKHFVYARHYPFRKGTRVQFLGSDGVFYDRWVEKNYEFEAPPGYAADLALAELDEPLPPAVQPVAVGPNQGVDYSNKVIYIYGKRAKIGTNEVPSWWRPGLDLLPWQYGMISGEVGRAVSEKGDSGSPTFTIIEGELALVGVRWFATGDSFVPYFFAQIDEVLESQGYSLRVAGAEGTDRCVADWDDDGELEFFDLIAYLTEYLEELPETDLNIDYQIDFGDLIMYLDEFAAGCK